MVNCKWIWEKDSKLKVISQKKDRESQVNSRYRYRCESWFAKKKWIPSESAKEEVNS